MTVDSIIDHYFKLDKKSLEEASDDINIQTVKKSKKLVARPSMYEVLIINDDFTPIDFVIMVLKMLFNKSDAEANAIAMATHTSGKGLCGVYTHDVAETKLMHVIDFARANNYPLKCIMNKAK